MENNTMLIICKQQNYSYFIKRERRKGAASWICDACVAFNNSPGTGFKRQEPTRGKLDQNSKIVLGWWDATIPLLVDYSLYIPIKGFGFAQPTSSPILFLIKEKKLLKSLLLLVLEEFDEPY